MINLYDSLFLAFSLNIIISCILTINAYNSIAGLISLIFAFINSTFLFFLLKLEFIALLILIVYVGAISVLFLFSVMLFNLKEVVRSKTTNIILKSFFYFFIFFSFSFFIIKYTFIFEKSLDFIILLPNFNITFWNFQVINTFFIEMNDILNFTFINLKELQNNLNNNLNLNNTFLYTFFISNINNELYILGQVFYDQFFIYLITTGLILLIGMIGAVVLINNTKEQLQMQHSNRQISKDFNTSTIRLNS